MMPELIKMSLFCDTDGLNEVVLDNQAGEQTDSNHETCSTEPELTSCDGQWTVSQAISHFFTTTAEARVDISTFCDAQPDILFESNYLQPIVNVTMTVEHVNDHDKTHEQCKTEGKTRPCNDRTHIYGDDSPARPPYSFRGLVCAAIFLSDLKIVKKQDVIECIKDMFEVFQIDDVQWQKKWQRNVLKGHSWEKKTLVKDAGGIKLRYEEIDMHIFFKAWKKGEKDGYDDNLFTQIGCPQKFEELRRVVKKAKREAARRTTCPTEVTRKRPSQTSPSKGENVGSQRRKIVKENQQEVLKETGKNSSLRLPPRPCFNDDSSNESLTLNNNKHAPRPILPDLRGALSSELRGFTPIGGFPSTGLVYTVPYLFTPTR